VARLVATVALSAALRVALLATLLLGAAFPFCPAVSAADVEKLRPPVITARGNLQRPLVILSHLNVPAEGAPGAAITLCRAPKDRSGCASVFAAGQLPLHPPDADTETIALLTGPRQNGGDLLRVAALEQDGRRLTLVLEHWCDNQVRHPNVPVHTVYAVSLGTLPAGEHSIDWELREFFRDAQKKEGHHRPRSISTGVLAFRVKSFATAKERDPKPSTVPGAVPALDRGLLVSKPVSESAGKRRLQVAYPTNETTRDDGSQGQAGGLRVGQLDVGVWRANRAGFLPVPELAPPETGKRAYAVLLGPSLNPGERMTLREIEWVAERAILRVDIWRQAGGAADVEGKFRPLLAVPLYPEQAEQGRFPEGTWRLEVEWSLLFAQQPGAVYRRALAPEIAADPRAHTIERAFVVFTRRAGSSLWFETSPAK
jgi:hypothetical protein